MFRNPCTLKSQSRLRIKGGNKMKLNIKKIVSLVFAVAMLCASIPADAAVPPPITTMEICTYCKSNLTQDVCMGDYTYYTTGSGTHLPGSSCRVSFYQATGFKWCPKCYKNLQTYGKHNCYQVHSSCGQGKVWTCPMGITVSGNW